MSYLFICHDIALVQNFCDRVLVMYHGKMVEEGKPDEVICHPKEAYTRADRKRSVRYKKNKQREREKNEQIKKINWNGIECVLVCQYACRMWK